MPQVEITAMTFGPFGLGTLGGKTVMVSGTVPGDIVEVTPVETHRDYVLARLDRVVRPAPERRMPPCPFLPRCGGCDWQQISYAAQVRWKAEVLANELSRALGLALDPADLVEPAPAEFGYRARIRLKVGPGGELGFHEPRSNRLVVVDQCMLAVAGLRMPSRLARALKGRCVEIEVVREERHEVLVAHLKLPPGAFEIGQARAAVEADAELGGVVLRCGARREVIGEVTTRIDLEPGLSIEADADVFSQVNRAQNQRLVAAIMAMAEIGDESRVLDLFCGAGNLSLAAAFRGARVTGADSDELAVAAARRNAKRLGLERAEFFVMSAAEALRFLGRADCRPDTVIIDPPRAGARDVMEALAKMRAPGVVYVSCNLSTLARDLKALIGRGYRVQTLRAFDFFPNTHHAEIAAHAVLTSPTSRS